MPSQEFLGKSSGCFNHELASKMFQRNNSPSITTTVAIIIQYTVHESHMTRSEKNKLRNRESSQSSPEQLSMRRPKSTQHPPDPGGAVESVEPWLITWVRHGSHQPQTTNKVCLLQGEGRLCASKNTRMNCDGQISGWGVVEPQHTIC